MRALSNIRAKAKVDKAPEAAKVPEKVAEEVSGSKW